MRDEGVEMMDELKNNKLRTVFSTEEFFFLTIKTVMVLYDAPIRAAFPGPNSQNACAHPVRASLVQGGQQASERSSSRRDHFWPQALLYYTTWALILGKSRKDGRSVSGCSTMPDRRLKSGVH